MIYDHDDYRAYLKSALDAGHGSRSRLARATGCSPSWITRVLAGTVQLTPDQALAVAEHFGLSDAEADYFLLLVDLDRAATPALRRRLERRAQEARAAGRNLSSSLRTDFSISDAHRLRYYSSWVYPSVHVACMIRALTAEEVSALTGLGAAATADALRELATIGLVRAQGGRWEATMKNIHLPTDHMLTNVIHASWRQRTTQALQERAHPEGLHYSGVHCLSRADVEHVRRLLTDALVEARKRIEASPSETLAVFCLDWYQPSN